MSDETLKLKPGSRIRTGGATYEVTSAADVPAGAIEVEPQATRLLKVYCVKDGYTARITQRWIKRDGTPDCPRCKVRMIVEDKTAAKPAKPASKSVVAEVTALLAEDGISVADYEAEVASIEPSALALLLAAEL